MEQLLKEHERLEKKANLGKTVQDVDILLEQLKNTREAVARDPENAADRLEAQQKLTRIQFDRVNEDLKDIHGGLNKYSKALEKKFNKDRPLPIAESDALAGHSALINRAISMHLLREGHFDVAAKFIYESNVNPTMPASATDLDARASAAARHIAMASSSDQPPNMRQPSGLSESEGLQQHFSEMYRILEALRQHQDLEPAILWAREHSTLLEHRGSNLEYDLSRLQYIKTFMDHGAQAALAYGRIRLCSFPGRYAQQTQELMGALAFIPDLASSPYANLFSNSNSETTMAASSAFTAEFCALLSLSSASPLLTAVTAGCMALPTLLKLSQIQQMHRTSWTTANELPVEVPLPPAYQFHSVFVCPVSKEQSTDANPPMMMPCRHVICKESLDRVSRGMRFKCPYCPAESHPKDARQVFL